MAEWPMSTVPFLFTDIEGSTRLWEQSPRGDAVWCVNPDEVIQYHLTRRHTRIDTIRETAEEQRYRLTVDGIPDAVSCRALTLEAGVPAPWCRMPVAWINSRPVPAELVRPRCLRVTVEVTAETEVRLGDASAGWGPAPPKGRG